MALLIGLIFWGTMFALGYRTASRKTSNPVAQIFLGIFLGFLFMAGLTAVLMGIAFAGCVVIMSLNR